MTTVELQFLNGRYHATPWGRHVNEAAVEWPPSPYRFLRALYDCWQRRHSELSEARVRGLFEALGKAAPSFHLPQAVSAHTRSYLSSNTKSASDKSLIFDGFISVNPGRPCFVQWPVDLTKQQAQDFGVLLGDLNYLGRSESWVEAKLRIALPVELNCRPSSDLKGADDEAVQVAAATSPAEHTGKRSWFDSLTYSTTEMTRERSSGPPAMRMVSYWRSRDAIATWMPPPQVRKASEVAVIELSLHAKVLPLATDTIPIAELVRKGLMNKAVKPSAQFSGKDADSLPLKDHSHAYFLPQFDGLDRIDRVLVIVRKDAFEADELRAVRELRRLWRRDEDSIRIVVTRAVALRELPESRTVVSTTPFLPARFWRDGRGSWHDFVVDEVFSECLNHGLPEPVRVSIVERGAGERRFELVHYRRSRKGEAPRRGEFLEIEFAEPVRMPFSLGYCSHYGMGQFLAGRELA